MHMLMCSFKKDGWLGGVAPGIFFATMQR